MIYRREIDGLRAIAVIPVIAFHAGLKQFSGGFVGVDVFFVISGYLITSILVSEFQSGDFSIARFYERRARRILPALAVVMLCCIPFAWVWMTPDQLRDFAQSIAAVALFSSNILFLREEGYFAPAAELKPLLHTWSLAVEEQYYLLFPLFLAAVWHRGRKRLFWSISAIAGLSLVASEWASRHAPGADFYLAPTRAWELLTGSICALLLLGRPQPANNALGLAGLTLIVVSVVTLDQSTPFPGLYALAPVLGTALIILFAPAETWTGRFLGWRGFVGIGLISYSAYLWHQPLFAFARIRSILEPSPWLMAGLALLSLALAWVSWRYVERPFRSGPAPLLPTRRAVFAASATCAIALIALGAAGHLGHGFAARFDAGILRYAAPEAGADNSSINDCLIDRNRPHSISFPQPGCTYGAPSHPDVMLIGDSHMWALHRGLQDDLKAAGINYYFTAYIACPPLPGLRVFNGARSYECTDLLDKSFNFAERAGIKTVVIGARYLLYLDGGYDNGEGGSRFLGPCMYADVIEATSCDRDDSRRKDRVLSRIEHDVRMLSKRFNVVLVYPIPEPGWNVPVHAFKVAAFAKRSENDTSSYDRYIASTSKINSMFDKLSAELPNVFPARVQEALCNRTTRRCINADQTSVYYFDDNHLSIAGAHRVAPIILEALRKAQASERPPGTPGSR